MEVVREGRKVRGEVKEMRWCRTLESILTTVGFPDSEMGFEQKKDVLYFMF